MPIEIYSFLFPSLIFLKETTRADGTGAGASELELKCSHERDTRRTNYLGQVGRTGGILEILLGAV